MCRRRDIWEITISLLLGCISRRSTPLGVVCRTNDCLDLIEIEEQKANSWDPEWTCATCNDALSDTERQAIKFVLGMCGVTILSFTWFVGGLGAVL